MINTPSALVAATYLVLLLSVVGLWFGRWVWAGALAVSVVVGYVSGVLYGPALLWIAVLAALCIGYVHSKSLASRATRIALTLFAACAILAVSILLAMHALPGFHNFLVIDRIVLSKGAEPYTLYLNFDKTLVGVFIIGLVHRSLLANASRWSEALRRAVQIVPIHVAIVAAAAAAIGYLSWQPKWTSLFWVWAPVNLFFVCLAEEAVFRGFIQRELTKAMRNVRAGAAFAVIVGAVLFGLAHFAGGVSYVVLATAAGLGYGAVYHRTQSVEMAMLAHFTLNTVHFLLFTYPRVA